MKLSKSTIDILTNYATMNPNILLTAGNVIKTINTSRNVFSSVTLEDSFPIDFGIYDIGEFLRVVSLFEDPDFEFNNKFVTVSSGRSSAKYYSADESVLLITKKDAQLGEKKVEFELSADNLSKIMKAAAALRAGDLSIVGGDGKISVIVHDKTVSTSNVYSFVVGDTDKEFQVHLKISSLQMVPTDYIVAIDSKVTQFKAVKSDLVYYLAIERDSKFN